MLQLICGVPVRRGAGGVALGRQLACQVRQVLVHAVTAVCQPPRPQAVNSQGQEMLRRQCCSGSSSQDAMRGRRYIATSLHGLIYAGSTAAAGALGH